MRESRTLPIEMASPVPAMTGVVAMPLLPTGQLFRSEIEARLRLRLFCIDQAQMRPKSPAWALYSACLGLAPAWLLNVSF
jgi:hypothetical protein